MSKSKEESDSENSDILYEQDQTTAQFNLSIQPLKKDHNNRPIWVDERGHIFLERFSPISELAQDFLIAIAEPVSRPTFIHEYKLTPYSLYAAVSVGLQPQDIIDYLGRLSKMNLSPGIVEFIETCTRSVGKIKLVLKQNRYFVESSSVEILQSLINDEQISEARVSELNEHSVAKVQEPKWKSKKTNELAIENIPEDLMVAMKTSEETEDLEINELCHSFEIQSAHVENVKKRCIQLDFPMLEEYDYRNDLVNPNLDIDLKPSSVIRPYQEKSLSKMFVNGRARSGIIVLPCGAGKTLVGITAACTIKKSVLILCTSAVSVEQWKREFLRFSTVSRNRIALFTSKDKEMFSTDSGIVVSTYTMVAFSGKRSHDAQLNMDFLQSREWGLLILDEVHVVPAQVFRKVLTNIATHAKLGLTATLVREDEKIGDLNFLIGPKLYEANWLDLAQQGHIANVQCAEVWCPMTAEFYGEYLRQSTRKCRLLHVMNPIKFQTCQFLIQFHEKRQDKIIVFSDNVYALRAYARKLDKPFIYGGTGQDERMRIIEQFRVNPAVSTLFLSKVGDTSIDLPEATVLIQISSHYGSRRQEAQRLGRILRAKKRNDQGFNAFFYSLVSKDTTEMYYSSKRQQFLIDQGYAFKVITKLDGMEKTENLVYSTREQQLALLKDILMASETELEADDAAEEKDQDVLVKRSKASLKSISGGDSMAYMEVKKPKHKLFIQRAKKH